MANSLKTRGKPVVDAIMAIMPLLSISDHEIAMAIRRRYWHFVYPMSKPHAFSSPISRYLASFTPIYALKAEIVTIMPSNPHGYFRVAKWAIMAVLWPFSQYGIINPVYEALLAVMPE